MDSRPAAEFDVLDEFIARHGLDLVVAAEAMALDDVAFARLVVDPMTPRAEVVRLAAGMTPAKLARGLSLLRPVELGMAMTKLRARRTPSNQAHVRRSIRRDRRAAPLGRGAHQQSRSRRTLRAR